MTGQRIMVAPPGSESSRAPSGRLWGACRELEAAFAVYLVRAMRAAASEEAAIPGGGVYEGFIEDALGRCLAERGSLGLARALYAGLSRRAGAETQNGLKESGRQADNPVGGDE